MRVQSIRQVVRARIKQLGVSGYRLSRAVNKDRSRRAVYEFTAKGSKSSVKTETLDGILHALGLKIVPIDGDAPIASEK